MNVLILGGQSPRHKLWVRQVAGALQTTSNQVVFVDYKHWLSYEPDIDIDYEIAHASHAASQLGEYVVVAKSIGSVITMLAIARGKLSPKRCVFMGFPLAVVKTAMPEVATALPLLPPTVFLHNDHDPLGSAAETKKYIEAHAPKQYDFRVLPGDTHDYEDFELIKQLTSASKS